MENALALPGRISAVQTLSFSRGYCTTRPQGGAEVLQGTWSGVDLLTDDFAHLE